MKSYVAAVRTNPVLTGVVVAAIVLRFPALGQQSLWNDEALTAWQLHQPLGTEIANLPKLEASPPLYFLLNWAWTRVFGLGEAGLRSLSAVAGVALIPVVYATAQLLLSRRAGLIAAALAAFSPALVWYSQEARPYSLAYLLSTVSFLFFARVLLIARGEPSAGRASDSFRRSCLLWAVASALAISTHYFAWFLVFPEAVCLLVITRRRRRERRWSDLVGDLSRPVLIASLALAAIAGCLLALAIYQRTEGGATDLDLIKPIPVSTRLKGALSSALFGETRRTLDLFFHLDLYIFQYVVVLMLATLGPLLVWRGTQRQRRAAGFCLLTVAVGIALPVAAGLTGANYIVGRYLLVLLPIFLVGFAIAIAETRPRWVGAALAGLLCAGSLMVLVNVVAHRWAQREDWRGAARALGVARVDRAIVAGPAFADIDPAPRLIALTGVYLQSVQEMPEDGRPVSEIDVLQVAGAPIYPPAAHPRTPLPGFRLVARRGNGNFELFRYVSQRPMVASPTYLNRKRLIPGRELLPEHTQVGLQRASTKARAQD